ncbi:MAG: hypothetical protein ACO36I_13475, partial [Candidatus Latescibacterota bacterium]
QMWFLVINGFVERNKLFEYKFKLLLRVVFFNVIYLGDDFVLALCAFVGQINVGLLGRLFLLSNGI